MTDNKLVKTIMDAATLTGFADGIGWGLKKVAKENFTSDPKQQRDELYQDHRRHSGQHCAQTILRGPKNPSS